MRLPHLLYTSLFCLASILIVPASTADAQEEPAPAVTSTQDPALDKAAIQARIDEVEKNEGLKEATKQTALENLRSALKDLENAEKYQVRTEEHKRSIAEDPAAAGQIRTELEAAVEPVDPAAYQNLSLQEARSEHDQQQSALSSSRDELGMLEAAMQALEKRPALAREEQSKVAQDLAQTDADMKQTPAEGTPELLVETRNRRLTARRHTFSRQQQMLDQELLSLPMQLELAKARHARLQRQVDGLVARSTALDEVLAPLRRAEAEAAQQQAEAAQQAAADEHPVVQKVAKKNTALSDQHVQVVADQKPASEAKDRATARLQRVQEMHSRIAAQLESGGLSGSSGSILRRQRQQMAELLNDLRQSRQRWRARSTEVDEQRLELYLMRRELADPNLATESLLAAAEPPLAGAERSSAAAKILSLLTTRVDLVEKLEGDYGKLLGVLSELRSQQDLLRTEVRAFASLLDQWLLWMPSTTAAADDLPGQLVSDFQWLISPDRWSRSLEILQEQVQAHWLLAALAFAALALLLIMRGTLHRRLETISTKIRRISSDRIGLTWQALGLTILLLAPLPFLVAIIAQALLSSDSTTSIAIGLYGATGMGAVIGFVRLLCAPKGIAALHFKWSAAKVATLRRHLSWLRWLLVPAAYLVYATNAQPNEEIRNGLGRIGFIIGALALLIFWQRILRPSGEIIRPILAQHPSGWLARLKWIWYPSALAAPLSLALLAFLGYYYTALELDDCVIGTILLFLVVVLLRAIAMRWLLIEQRRMAVQRFKEQREASLEQATSDQAEASKEAEIPLPEDFEVDLSAVNEQTRQLVRMASFFTLLLGVWGIWYGVLPALGFLDSIELWTYTAYDSDANPVEAWKTLQDLFLALIVLALTVTATRNVPGLLQVVVLKNLPMEPSTRYAIVTVARYLLMIVGVVAGCQMLGFEWSSVQWLVAAFSVGIGFGLQEIIANFICGLILLFERPVRIGDSVTIGDTSGTVSRIRMRATTIIDWDRKEMVIPNKELITGRVLNWTLSSPLNRTVIPVGVAYGTDTEMVRQLLLEVAKADSHVLKDPEPLATFEGFGASSLDFLLRAYLKDYEGRLGIISELRSAIDKRFKAAGIEIAFPQLDLHLRSAEAAVEVKSNVTDLPPPERQAKSPVSKPATGAEAG